MPRQVKNTASDKPYHFDGIAHQMNKLNDIQSCPTIQSYPSLWYPKLCKVFYFAMLGHSPLFKYTNIKPSVTFDYNKSQCDYTAVAFLVEEENYVKLSTFLTPLLP